MKAILLALAMLPVCLGQKWEVGGAGSYSFYRNVTASSPAGSAKVGFASAAGLSVVGGENVGRHFGGEARYTYGFGGLKIDGNQTATMNGDSHAFSYEFLVYGSRSDSAIRPFLAVGGGAKLYRGTGPEVAFQPLSGIAVLTRTSEFKPLVSIGGGVKVAAGKHALFRLDLRDHATPFPTEVIVPRPPSGRAGGWLHNFLVLAGISTTF